MKTIFTKVKLSTKQIVSLLALILLSAVGQMLLPSFLAEMINSGVSAGSNKIIWTFAAIMAAVTVFSCIISFLVGQDRFVDLYRLCSPAAQPGVCKGAELFCHRDGQVRHGQPGHPQHL